jgi:hypothetical protein
MSRRWTKKLSSDMQYNSAIPHGAGQAPAKMIVVLALAKKIITGEIASASPRNFDKNNNN